jgi:hypothetical protein
MATAPAAKLVEPGQGKTIMLFAVRFDYKVTGADSGGALAALEVVSPGGLEDYFEELERTYQVKL